MSELPELFDSRLRARSLAYLFCAVALISGLTIFLPRDHSIDELGLGLTGLAAAGVGAGLLGLAGRLALWQLHAALALGTAMVALANEFAGQTALFALLFSWPILYACYFFERPAALGQVALAGVAYAIVLIAAEPASSIVRWVVAIGTPTAAGLLIWRLLDRVRAEKVDALERALLLQQNEARTRIVLDSAPDAFVAIDRD